MDSTYTPRSPNLAAYAPQSPNLHPHPQTTLAYAPQSPSLPSYAPQSPNLLGLQSQPYPAQPDPNFSLAAPPPQDWSGFGPPQHQFSTQDGVYAAPPPQHQHFAYPPQPPPGQGFGYGGFGEAPIPHSHHMKSEDGAGDGEWMPGGPSVGAAPTPGRGRKAKGEPAVKMQKMDTGGVEVKTKFPTARIKRIMQADEDVGKVAQVTPVVMAKALELFMIRLVTASASVAKNRGSRRVLAAHMKAAVMNDDQFDNLREIVGKVPDAPTRAGGDDDDDDTGDGVGKGKGRKKAAAGTKRRRKGSDDDS